MFCEAQWKRNKTISILLIIVLGFLNLNIPTCSGNLGLKDQSMALKWVNENIHAFGGDPNNVTVFGESAGSTCAHYHLLSPRSKNFVKRGIIQSGGAFVRWATPEEPEEKARLFGEFVGYRGNNSEEMVHFLQKISAERLAMAAFNFSRQTKKAQLTLCQYLQFVPSLEKIKENAFLPNDLFDSIEKENQHLSLMTGVTANEGMVIFLGNVIPVKDHVNYIIDNLFDVIINNVQNVDETRAKTMAEKVREYYFNNVITEEDKIGQVVNLFSDLYYLRMYDSVNYLVKTGTPVFYYEFIYRGNLSRSLNSPLSLEGSHHADDLGYLLYSKKFRNVKFEGRDREMIENMCKLWTDFAKTGDPTSTTSNLEVKWKPYEIENPSYLSIGEKMEGTAGYIWGARRKFWLDLLKM